MLLLSFILAGTAQFPLYKWGHSTFIFVTSLPTQKWLLYSDSSWGLLIPQTFWLWLTRNSPTHLGKTFYSSPVIYSASCCPLPLTLASSGTRTMSAIAGGHSSTKWWPSLHCTQFSWYWLERLWQCWSMSLDRNHCGYARQMELFASFFLFYWCLALMRQWYLGISIHASFKLLGF